jgi:hypothetical protein
MVEKERLDLTFLRLSAPVEVEPLSASPAADFFEQFLPTFQIFFILISADSMVRPPAFETEILSGAAVLVF